LIALPAGSAKTSFIDALDISAVASALLTSDKFNNREFDLSGPAAVDHIEVAKAISDVAGKQIQYRDIAPEELKKGLVAAGLPVDYVDFMILIFGFLKAGYNERITDSVKEITGQEPRSLNAYAKAHKASWA
jgi:uncharacterized protein YbjT (DUF2867 family)